VEDGGGVPEAEAVDAELADGGGGPPGHRGPRGRLNWYDAYLDWNASTLEYTFVEVALLILGEGEYLIGSELQRRS